MTFPPVQPSPCTQTRTDTACFASSFLFSSSSLRCNGVSRFVCAGRTWRGEDNRYRSLGCCLDWLRLGSGDAAEDANDPIKGCCHAAYGRHTFIRVNYPCTISLPLHPAFCPTLDIQFTVDQPIRREEDNTGTEQQLQTASPRGCDAPNMTESRKCGCKTKGNDRCMNI